MVVSLLIFAITITLVVWQPRGLGIGWSALGGAIASLALGTVQPADVLIVWGIVWNASFTFVAIIIVSLLLDEAGFFEWAALHVARWGRGNGRLLYAWLILLGAAVSALFANDGAALILTPIVMAMLLALRFPPAATLAFVMGAGFVADTASLPLLISNLVNIVTADYFGIGFARYAAVMIPVNLVAVAATLAVLLLVFRRRIPERYAAETLRSPREAIRDPITFRAAWWVLGLLLAGFFLAETIDIPLSLIAAAAALALAWIAARSGRIATRRVLSQAPWQIVLFSLGMYVVVYGLRNYGLTAELSRLLDLCADYGVWGATFGAGLLAALLSSVMNNLPSVLVVALSIDASQADGAVREAMIYANAIGSDLGPKFTPIGSLATLLWLHVLERKGLHIGWWTYCRLGLVLTTPVLLLTLAGLALRLQGG